jgi:hypothetical protein
MHNKRCVGVLGVTTLTSVLSGCTRVAAPVDCADSDFLCIENAMLDNMKALFETIGYWSTLQLVIGVCVVLSGMVATIMIALQGDANRYWTRPIGLIATALVTGLTSALVSFHVPDNVDKLIDVYQKMNTVAGQYSTAYELLQAGRSKEEIEKQYTEDQEFRKKVVEMKEKYVGEFSQAKLDGMRIYGSAGRLTLPAKEPKP